MGEAVHPTWMPICVCAALLPVHLYANGPGKAAENGPTIWACSLRMRDLNDAPGFHLAQRRPLGSSRSTLSVTLTLKINKNSSFCAYKAIK